MHSGNANTMRDKSWPDFCTRSCTHRRNQGKASEAAGNHCLGTHLQHIIQYVMGYGNFVTPIT